MNAAQDSSPSSRSPTGRVRIDAATIMRIKNLQLRAKVVVEGFFNGLHRSPFHGFSAEFSEYRQYTAGDDTKYIDWRLFARSDRYYLKRFEDETSRRCYLILDQSRSMSFGSVEYPKSEYARTLAATLAYYLTLQRDSVGLLTFDETVRDFIPARFRHGHLRALLSHMEGAPEGQSTNAAAAVEQIASLIKKRGLVVLISDFLTPIAELHRPLSYLRSRGHEVMAFRVLDPAEVTFDFDQTALFRDLESRQTLYVDAATAREGYLAKFSVHQRELQQTCDSLGISLRTFLTTAPLELALSQWLAHQSQRPGRNAGRRRSPPGGGSVAPAGGLS